MTAPIIAITTDRRTQGPKPESDNVRPARPEVFVGESVVHAVRAAGGIPVLIPPLDSEHSETNPRDVIAHILGLANGVVITGGAFDIHPAHYGQGVTARIDRIDEGRTALELALAKAAIDADIPLLGICGGMQAMAVAGGGTLIQDIGTTVAHALEHEQPTDPATSHHPVTLTESPLLSAYSKSGTPVTIQVNSTHHQAVDDPGAFTTVGTAPDGVIEAICHPHKRFCVGVQWHPEQLDTAPYRALIEACR